MFKQAQQLHQQGEFAQAEQLYRQILINAPYHAETLHLLGVTCTQQGKHEEAITWLQKAIKKQPVQPVFYNNLGLVYAKLHMWEQAISAFIFVTRLTKNFPEVWFNLANVYKAQNHIDKAIEHYQKAIKFAPKHAKAMYNLGNTLLEIGKPLSAREWYEKAIAIQPDYAEAHNNLGSALEDWNEYELALQHYEKSVELKPNFTDAVKNLGNAYLKRGDYEKGKNLIASIVDDKKSTGWEELKLASLSPVIYESSQAIDDYLEQLEQMLEHYMQRRLRLDVAVLHNQNLEIASGLPYLGHDLTLIQSLYGKIFSRALPALTLNQLPKTKPHVGFVVTNGHEGVFMKCMAGIINDFDTLHFDVSIVCSLPNGKEKIQPAITNPQVNFVSLPKQLDLAVELLLTANFDVLHYWEVGTDYQNYFLPFFRIAPIQCATWGWPVTTGIPTIDYFLSCALLETEDADAHYTEKLIRFKKLPTYYLRPPVPEVLEPITSFGLPDEVPIYVCAQNLRKVHPHFDYLVAAILRQDSNGWIVFIHDARANITALLQARLKKICGKHFERVVFLERMSEARYLNLIAKADVLLDTLYYTGGANTAYDAFATGTPYVTLPWDFHRGRYGAAAYQQIGVEDAIATDLGDYIAKAVRIANDKTYRAALSEKIRTNAHKVFEDLEAVRELEQFFLAQIEARKTIVAPQ